jgi:hypothetical protein
MIMPIMIRRPVTVDGESLGRPRPVQLGTAAAFSHGKNIEKQLWSTKIGYTIDEMAKIFSNSYN